MKVSQLKLTSRTLVETTTDACQVLTNENQRRMYIDQFGDVEVIEEQDEYSVHRVPAFAAQIAAYTKMKAADCIRWGCE